MIFFSGFVLLKPWCWHHFGFMQEITKAVKILIKFLFLNFGHIRI